MTAPTLLKFDGQPIQIAAGQLCDEIKELIYDRASKRDLPLAIVLGVLQIAAAEILEEQR